MVHYKNSRHNGGFEPYVVERDFTPTKAFEALVFCEIGFGTSITGLTSTQILCNTNVLGTIDVVEFTGTEQEMRPLVMAAAYYIAVLKTRRDEVIENVLELLPKQPSGGVRGFDLVNFSGLLNGHSVMGTVSLLAVGVTPTETLLKNRPGDLLAAATLQLETGVPVENILA